MKSDFHFSRFGESEYLITNYAGRYCFLTEQEFRAFCEGKPVSQETKKQLRENYFLSTDDPETFLHDYSKMVSRYRNYLFSGTGLHIFVLTSRCNLKCVYCQASTVSCGEMMSEVVAEKGVDLALESPNRYLSFEFQGGEPLMNFPTLKQIVLYTERKSSGRVIHFNLVSNLTLLTEEMIDFIVEHHISVSTSLDGNMKLHNKNRPYPGMNSFLEWKRNYDRLRNVLERDIGAIQTTTRFSLDYPEELVDQYINAGFSCIFIRPLTPLGYAASRWAEIGYTAEEFIKFYRRAFFYILEKGKQGIHFEERHAALFLEKLFLHRAGNYTELTSPCGAALGQLAYNYDGNIYTCDEGRMMAEMGDHAFQVGTVDDKYEDLFNSPTCKAMATASCLECIPQCTDCVYSPYCGTCPVLTYYENHSIFASEPNGYKCKINQGILDLIFEVLRRNDPKEIQILQSWV